MLHFRILTISSVFIFGLLALGNRAQAKGNCGGEIVFDCGNHTVTIAGQKPDAQFGQGTIDCGANGATKEGTGKIGKKHNVNIVKCGAEILDIAGMGQDGGGKVIHTNNPGAECPTNDANGTEPSGGDISKGCLIVHPKLMEHILDNCEGETIRIVNAGGKGKNGDKSTSGQSSGSELDSAAKQNRNKAQGTR